MEMLQEKKLCLAPSFEGSPAGPADSKYSRSLALNKTKEITAVIFSSPQSSLN